MRASFSLRVLFVAAALAAGAAACTSGTTPDCDDGACGVVFDATTEQTPGEDGGEDAVPDVAPETGPVGIDASDAGGGAEGGDATDDGHHDDGGDARADVGPADAHTDG